MSTKNKNKSLKKAEPAKKAAGKKSSNLLPAWICVAIISLITYLVFSPSLQAEFTNWDDNAYVSENPLVAANSIDIKQIFTTPVSLHYHPLTILSLAINYQDGKLDPSGYHFENNILHVLNTILVFFFVFLLTRRNLLMAAIVSLFFGIHPMHVESVSWVSERKDVLYVFFFMAGLISYLRYTASKKIAWYLTTLLLFILACLSKEMAVVFPAILLLIDYLQGAKWQRKIIIEKIPFFLLALILVIVEVKIQSVNTAGYVKTYSILQRIMFASYSAISYVIRLFVPYKLSAFYPYPDTTGGNSLPFIFYLSPFLLLALLGIIIYAFFKNQREIVFGLLFYLVAIVLVVQFVPINPGITPDRYSYLSYIGLLFAVAYLINKAWQSKSGIYASLKYPFITLAMLGAVVFSYQAYARAQIWQNSETLWTNVIKNYPQTATAYGQLGSFYLRKDGKTDEALSDLSKGIKLQPNFPEAYINRAEIYAKKGKLDSALMDCDSGIKYRPVYPDAYSSRAKIYGQMGKFNLAVRDCDTALKQLPNYPGAYVNRGIAHAMAGQIDSAMIDFLSAVHYDHNLPNVYLNIGNVYDSRNMRDSAIINYTRSIQLDATQFLAFEGRGRSLREKGSLDAALNDLDQALQLNPNAVGSYYERSLLYREKGDKPKALQDAIKARSLGKPLSESYIDSLK